MPIQSRSLSKALKQREHITEAYTCTSTVSATPIVHIRWYARLVRVYALVTAKVAGGDISVDVGYMASSANRSSADDDAFVAAGIVTIGSMIGSVIEFTRVADEDGGAIRLLPGDLVTFNTNNANPSAGAIKLHLCWELEDPCNDDPTVASTSTTTTSSTTSTSTTTTTA